MPTAKIDARALRNQTTPVHAVVDRRDVATLKKLRPRNIRARSQPTTHLSLRPSINKTLSARGKPAARLSVSPASCPSNPSIRAPFAKNFQRGSDAKMNEGSAIILPGEIRRSIAYFHREMLIRFGVRGFTDEGNSRKISTFTVGTLLTLLDFSVSFRKI